MFYIVNVKNEKYARRKNPNHEPSAGAFGTTSGPKRRNLKKLEWST